MFVPIVAIRRQWFPRGAGATSSYKSPSVVAGSYARAASIPNC